MRMIAAIVLAAALTSGVASIPGACAEDNGDLVFWQSIQNSTNPAEYQAYLDAFPNGRFRALALLRLKHPPAPAAVPAAAAPAIAPAPAPNPTAVGVPAPAPAPEQPNIVGDGANKVVVQPTTARVGQKIKVSFSNFPDPNKDILVVVHAGTPDFDPTRRPADLKVLYEGYIYNKDSLRDVQIGPFAPGNYEARYLTTLYNNDGKYEASARTMFSVR